MAVLPKRRRTQRIREDFDALVSGRPKRDRYELFGRAREHAPIFFTNSLQAWVVSRYDDVRAVLEDAAAFGVVTDGPGMAILPGGFLSWRGREHSKKMGIVARRVRSPRALREDVGVKVGEITRDLAARLPIGEEVDLREQYAIWVPLLLICELTQVDEPQWLRKWYESMMAAAVGGRTYDDVRVAGLRAIQQLTDLLQPVVEERKQRPGPDLISDLLHATYDDNPLAVDEVIVVAAQLYGAIMEATERGLVSAFRQLACDPALSASLRERLADDDSLSSFGAETLRFYAPIQATTRQAREAADVAGRRLAPGERVVALLASANRDESRFADSDTFDAARFIDNPERQYTSSGDVLPFGAGEHHCVGSRLTRVIFVEAVRHVLERAERIELREEPIDKGGLIFWSPDSLRVVLHPAT